MLLYYYLLKNYWKGEERLKVETTIVHKVTIASSYGKFWIVFDYLLLFLLVINLHTNRCVRTIGKVRIKRTLNMWYIVTVDFFRLPKCGMRRKGCAQRKYIVNTLGSECTPPFPSIFSFFQVQQWTLFNSCVKFPSLYAVLLQEGCGKNSAENNSLSSDNDWLKFVRRSPNCSIGILLGINFGHTVSFFSLLTVYVASRWRMCGLFN